jgi:kynurenine formamidase
MSARLLDLSHTVEHGLVTYPGLPAPVVSDHLGRAASRERYAEGTEFQIGRIEMVANTGTYVDAPSHRFADGSDLAELPLECLADLPGVVVDAPAGARRIGPAALPQRALRGCAVLFRTGWSRHFGTPRYGEGHPFLSAELARELVRRGVALVGIDSLNVDDTEDGTRPVHTALLAAGIPIVEHLARLEQLPGTGFRFFAVPVKVRGMGSFPVRAFAHLRGAG